MTPQQLIQTVKDLRPLVNNGIKSWMDLDRLLTIVEIRIDQTVGVNIPLTQDQVNSIVAYYAPLYTDSLKQIETAGDALGTDPLH